MINRNIAEFHFLLGFARETHVDGNGTGAFKRYWNFNYFSPTKVAKLKKENKNVKVMISIGSHDIGYKFDPINKNEWIKKAKSSIKELILDYENEVMTDENIIDGIDINYEYITSSINDFSNCIGLVIQQLKDDPDVSKSMSVVSIAPITPTELLQPHYLKLYLDNKDNIDLIDYKFYNQSFKSTDDFVDLFNQLVTDYDAAYKLLAGVSTEMSTSATMSPSFFVDACTILINRASLAGVFVWDADASAPKYSIEKDLQKLLIKK
ncbi:unnamed protein product [Lathyrus sativus]|nr:unnamed protein product [Lathyrus sativus]